MNAHTALLDVRQMSEAVRLTAAAEDLPEQLPSVFRHLYGSGTATQVGIS